MGSDDGPHVALHRPVLASTVLEWLRPAEGGAYVDATVGLGGHAEQLLEAGAEKLVGLDRDPEALALAQVRLRRFGDRVRLRHGNFRHLRVHLQALGIEAAQGILFDLGFSSYQIEQSGRGFSFIRNEPLDMRFDPSQGATAREWLARASLPEIERALSEYGEEPAARRIARALLSAREARSLATTGELAELVKRAIPRNRWPRRLHVATRTFQAIRMVVNEEIPALAEALPQAAEHLEPGGRLLVIAFHSGEDRVVKQTFRRLAATHRWAVRTRRPVTPDLHEIEMNPRARSAKLRVLERH
ncbi:MAG: 16S rRNA (cytosine(1402)-N(4))-methyltransferase RsmH [Candidatus Rokubacteria bacterium]|nr:16S rRNA (cytosine(1402)-N(4))-methyltransferase RsmH [Candidatus Rokubacteria bacterium]